MDSKQYRDFARICIDLANSTSADKEMQRALFDMAKAWFAIASETEAREQNAPRLCGRAARRAKQHSTLTAFGPLSRRGQSSGRKSILSHS
jgi:hypothetical protein